MFNETAPKTENFLEDLQALSDLRSYLLKLIQIEERSLENCCADTQPEPIRSTYKGCTRNARQLKVTIQDLDALASAEQLYFVGFFGRKKPAVDFSLNTELAKVDAELTEELQNYPAILAYGYIELPDRYNYANLVIFNRWEDVERLKGSTNHQKAAWQVSPNFYDQIKIHSGVLAGGVSGAFSITRTNFYDFNAKDKKVVVNHARAIEAA